MDYIFVGVLILAFIFGQAMLVHPDKNMGSPLASESFKKLQCAYEVNVHFLGSYLFVFAKQP